MLACLYGTQPLRQTYMPAGIDAARRDLASAVHAHVLRDMGCGVQAPLTMALQYGQMRAGGSAARKAAHASTEAQSIAELLGWGTAKDDATAMTVIPDDEPDVDDVARPTAGQRQAAEEYAESHLLEPGSRNSGVDCAAPTSSSCARHIAAVRTHSASVTMRTFSA